MLLLLATIAGQNQCTKEFFLTLRFFFFLKKRFILKKFFWPWSRRLFRDTPLIPMPLNSADARSPIFLFLVYLFPLRLWWWEKSRKSTGARFFNINRKLGGAVVCRFLSGHRCGSARLYLFRSHSDFPVVVVGDFFSLGVLEKKKSFSIKSKLKKSFWQGHKNTSTISTESSLRSGSK